MSSTATPLSRLSATSPLAGWSDRALARIRGMDEEWRPVEGYAHYEVSSHGRVRSWAVQGSPTKRASTPATRKQFWNGRYWRIMLKQAGKRPCIFEVHRLVAHAFIGPQQPGMHVAHEDGNGSNNHVSNLAYKTPVENAADKIRHGTHRSEFDLPGTRLSNEQVDVIRARVAAGATQKSLVEEFGISKQHVSNIVLGKARNHGQH